MSFLTRILSKININKKHKVALFISMSLALLGLLTAGTSLQFYALSIINSSSSSLYDSAFKNHMVDFGSLSEWISSQLTLMNVVNSLTIIFSTTFFSKTKNIFFCTVIASIIIITITDTILLITAKSFAIEYFIESLISNVIGSWFIGAFVIFLYKICDSIYSGNLRSITFETISASLSYLFIFTLIVAGSYFIICFFYRPTATDFIINTGDNFSAYYYTHQKEKEKFTFIGDHPVKVSKNISLFGSFDNLSVVKNDNSKYDIEIGVYQGCIKETSNERIKNNYLKKFTDVSELSFTPPKMSFFGYIDSKESGNSLLVKDASVTAFASQLSDDKKSRRMSKSSAENDINYFMDNSGVTIHIITPTFASDEDKKNPIQKLNFHFKIGGLQKNINMTIKRNTLNNIKKIQSCSWINISNNYELDIDDLAAIGIIIRVTPKNNEYYYPEGGESGRAIVFSNLTGTININDVSLKSKLSSYVKPGFLSGFNVFSPKSVTIDDVSLEVKPGDTISSYKSEVYAQVTEEGEVLLKGTSKNISRNGSRLNKTLWEGSNAWSLSGVTVLGAIFVSLGFLIRKFFDVYNKNETISKIFKA